MLLEYQPKCHEVDIKLEELLSSLKKDGFENSDPSVYSMIKWICTESSQKTMIVDEFFLTIAQFYSESLIYIFQQFDD